MSQSRQQVINNLAKYCYNVVKSKGFHDVSMWDAYDKVDLLPSYLMNIHSEISELWEAYRNNSLFNPCNKAKKMKKMGLMSLTCLAEELADIIIRCLDVAHEFEIDIGTAIIHKMKYNETRPYKHGGKRV